MAEAGPDRDAQIAQLTGLTGLDAASVGGSSSKLLELLTNTDNR